MVKVISLFFITFLFAVRVQAQCPIENTFFESGEEISYDLYFKYGLLNTKAGVSSLKTSEVAYNGVPAYKMTLLAKSNGVINKIFTLSDTLTCYMSKDLIPLAYMKNAHEGAEHTKENTTYSYKESEVTIKTKLTRNDKLRFDETLYTSSCIYDMMSVIYYARTLDFTKMHKGFTTKVVFLSGKNKVNMHIDFQGIEIVKANDNKKYNCFKLILKIEDKAFEDKKEAMTVYVTNDNNRLPVRLNSNLKIGSTSAIMKAYKGNRYDVKSQ